MARLNAGDDTSDTARRSIATRGPSAIPAFYPRRSPAPPSSPLPRGAESCDPRCNGTLSRKPRLVVRAVGSETIVYDPRTHQAHCLGTVAAAVWRECDGHRSTSEIAERMRLAGGGPIDEASVAVALRRLERAGLVDGQASRIVAGPDGHGSGHAAGRRAALRRVAALAGLAVASLVVPTPEAAAATCKPNCSLEVAALPSASAATSAAAGAARSTVRPLRAAVLAALAHGRLPVAP